MKTNKILVGGVVGGVVLFLVSWVVWGILLKDYMIANYNQCFMNKDIIWWALIVSNIAVGLLFSTVFSFTDKSGIVHGIKAAAVIGFLMERREDWNLLWWLMLQRFGYRQIMYYVVLRSIATALRGPFVGWGKLERHGTVRAALSAK